jgi:hypothetical protein
MVVARDDLRWAWNGVATGAYALTEAIECAMLPKRLLDPFLEYQRSPNE